MSDPIAWISAHTTEDASAALPGMLGLISLTAARGVDPEEFPIALGADLDELAARTPYKELTVPVGQPGRPSPRVNPVMHETCRDWVYVLEDWEMATWPTGYRGVKPMRLCPDEEIICLTLDRWSPPSTIIHAPGDGHAWRADFEEDTGQSSDPDAALHATGTVYPSLPDTDKSRSSGLLRGARSTPARGSVHLHRKPQRPVHRPACRSAGELPSVLIPML